MKGRWFDNFELVIDNDGALLTCDKGTNIQQEDAVIVIIMYKATLFELSQSNWLKIGLLKLEQLSKGVSLQKSNLGTPTLLSIKLTLLRCYLLLFERTDDKMMTGGDHLWVIV